MYRCQNCHKVSKPKEKLNRIPFEYRKKKYDILDYKGRVVGQTRGQEIAKEIDLCDDCARKWEER